MGDYLKFEAYERTNNGTRHHNNVFNELQRILDDRGSYVVISKQKYKELLSKASNRKRTRMQQPEIKDQPND